MIRYKHSVGESLIHKDRKYKVWSRYSVGGSITYMLLSVPDGNFVSVKESEL